jgi:hypothetical protein
MSNTPEDSLTLLSDHKPALISTLRHVVGRATVAVLVRRVTADGETGLTGERGRITVSVHMGTRLTLGRTGNDGRRRGALVCVVRLCADRGVRGPRVLTLLARPAGTNQTIAPSAGFSASPSSSA